ncbi:MAG: M48 family metallopeptidase [Alphaproteobacteria bacterium]
MSAPSEGHRATYYDGRVAAARTARVTVEGSALVIRTEGETARWPVEAVRIVGRATDGPVRQLRHGDARLVVHEAAAFAALARACPQLTMSAPERRAHAREVALWIGGSFAAVAVLVFVIIPIVAASIAELVPRSAERRLGEVVRRQLFAQMGDRTCDGAAALSALKGALVRLHPQGADIELIVLDTPIVNAFTLPGGQIVLMRGLVEFTEAPDEVAGVLAHELAHDVHRHALKFFLKAATTSVLIGIVIGDVTGGTVLAAAGSFLAAAAYTREYEREADSSALLWLDRAGYGPSGIVRFFERLKAKEGDLGEGALRYLSTHPPLGERIAAADDAVPSRAPAFSDEEWRAIKALCR